jgi:membrane dipeptidase
MPSDTISRRGFLGSSAALATALPQAAAANQKIEHAKQVALDILKPSPNDLAHGLELHAKSIVFDGYGFAPRAAVEGDALRQAVEAAASDIELKDMREDMALAGAANRPAEQAELFQAWKASGVTCIFQNCGEEGNDPMVLVKRLARFTHLTDSLRDNLRRAVFPADVQRAKDAGAGCLYFTGNGVPLTQAWVSPADELRYVRIFYQLGIRMMHVTYNRRNVLGDGCAETSNGGLSDFGRAAVDELNRVGVIVDVAHSGWQTSLEAAQRSSKPMVASHSTCGALYEHIRSKPDKVIRAIVDTGGYIGICCISRFLRRSGDIAAFLDHIDHVVKKFGPDHVAIGTDVAYQSRLAAQEQLPPRRKQRTRWAALWPPDDFTTTEQMTQSLAWTNWPLFTVGMVQRGHSDEVIRKIIGGNVLRVLEANLVS